MHTYTIYDLPSKKDNEALALADCKEYLGDRYDYVVSTIRQELFCVPGGLGAKYDHIRFCCAFVGIEGYYPVRAMVREVLK